MAIQSIFDRSEYLSDSQDSPLRAQVKKTGRFQSSEALAIEAALTRISSPPPITPKKLSFEEDALFEEKTSKAKDDGRVAKRKLFLTDGAKQPKRLALAKDSEGVQTPFISKAKITPIAFTALDIEALEKKIQQESKNKAPPPTPIKKQSHKSIFTAPPPPSPFKIVFQNAQMNVIIIQGQYVSLTLLSDKGTYMNVYTAEGLNKRVIKVFNSLRSASSPIFLKKCMRTALNFYRETQKLGLPVATIHNAETALEDCYYNQERIAHEVDVLNPSHFEQVRRFFLIFLQNKHILFDLLPDNLRVTEEGVVTLIDFVEEDDDPWDVFCKHALQKWCELYVKKTKAGSLETLDFLNQFTRGFEQYGYELSWNPTISPVP